MPIDSAKNLISSISKKLKSNGLFCLIFWFLLVFIAVIDLYFLGGADSSISGAGVLLLFVTSTLIPLHPRLCGWIFLLLDTAFIVAPATSVGILGYVCVVVFFLWGWHSYKIDAILGALPLLGGFWFSVSFQLPAALMLLLMLGTGFALGSIMRRSAEERDAAVAQLWKAKLQSLEEAQQLKADLAMQLHDSLAGTLSVISKLAESVRQEAGIIDHTALVKKASFLEKQTRVSLKELREIIQLLDDTNGSNDQGSSFISVLARMESIASAAGINLELECEDKDLEQLPLELKSVLLAFVREVSTNLVKYAAPSTDAVLSISYSTDTIEVMAKNQYHTALRDSVISSGRGLNNLREKFEFAGGELDIWSVDNWWHVYGELPLEKGNINALQQS